MVAIKKQVETPAFFMQFPNRIECERSIHQLKITIDKCALNTNSKIPGFAQDIQKLLDAKNRPSRQGDRLKIKIEDGDRQGQVCT